MDVTVQKVTVAIKAIKANVVTEERRASVATVVIKVMTVREG